MFIFIGNNTAEKQSQKYDALLFDDSEKKTKKLPLQKAYGPTYIAAQLCYWFK